MPVGGKSDYMDEVFRTRAVDPDVARERGYQRYEAGDREAVLVVDQRLGEDPGWLSRALICGGWVLPKCAPMPSHSQFWWTPYAQLRPDHPVMARSGVHDHDGLLHSHRDEGRCACGANHAAPPVRRIKWPPPPDRPPGVWHSWFQPPLRGLARLKHESSLCEWAAVPKGFRLPVPVLDGRSDGKVLVPTGHLHPDTGEMVVPLQGQHAHLDWAKYMYVKGQGRAQRLSTHPRVRAAGFDAPEGLFVFVIEGTLKLDSVVSAGWPGIESGSVTLWDAYAEEAEAEWEEGDFGETHLVGGMQGFSELEEFAERHLEGIPTAIVCDSDWAENRLVRDQVDKAVSLLARCGVLAVGCAPPPGESRGWTHPVTALPMVKKQGVDDYLATFTPQQRHDALLDMPVREPACDDASGLETAAHRAAQKPSGVETNFRLLQEMRQDAQPDGLVPYRREQLARRVGRNRSNVDDARDRLVKTGALTPITKAERVSNSEGGVRSIAPVYRLAAELRPTAGRSLREWLTEIE
jgi:hypothetical protein